MIGYKLHVDHDTLITIAEYLESEGLIKIHMQSKSKHINANVEASITDSGIKKINQDKENLENPTQPFPHYNVTKIYKYISGDYTEKNITTGDIFKNIDNATIINKSNIRQAINKLKSERDEEFGEALLKVGEFIERSRNVSAGALLDKFNEELSTNSQPDKSNLKHYWSSIASILPTIAQISESVAKISALFT
jgi:hypothetical protein